LGVTEYCRIWNLGYADLARPLYQILKEAQKDIQPFIELVDKSENAFHRFKKAQLLPWVSQYKTSFNYMLMKREDWP
jgi:hypothetical protein